MDDASTKLFDSLRGETLVLHLRWKLYRHLYAGPKEDVVLLNRSAPSVFAILKSVLFDDCVLRICRITDPNSRGAHEYHSVYQLAESIRGAASESMVGDLEPALKELEAACSKMRTLRNAQIAHADLKHSLQIAQEPLPDISIDDVNTALRLLEKLLNRVEAPLRRSKTFYGDVLLPVDDDVDRLLSLLRKANARPSEA